MKSVFVSSTFKDMQFERDMLQTYAIPVLDAALQEYGEKAYFGDLRWGVNTTDLDSDEGSKKVLSVCLDQIDDCKPYMIVLVGERYGWIPAQTLLDEACRLKGIEPIPDISVTELEIDYGALLNPAYEGRILFYFRELDTSGMTEAERADYAAESPRHKEKVAQLKQRIRAVYPDHIRHYTATWDAKQKKVVGLDGFLAQVQQDLSRVLLSDLQALNAIPWQERCLLSADKWFAEQAKYIVDEFSVKCRYEGSFSGQMMRLCTYYVGEVGSGKTARLVTHYRATGGEKAAFCFGLDKFSTDELALVQVIAYKAEQMLRLPHETVTDIDSGVRRLATYIENLRKQEKSLCVFVDNAGDGMLRLLAQLEQQLVERFGEVSALTYGDTLSIVVAMGVDIPFYPFFPVSAVYEMCPLADKQAERVLDGIVRSQHKEIAPMVKNRILSKRHSEHADYLRSMVKRLLMLDSDDFASIRAMGDGMDNINRYMLSIVDQTSNDRYGICLELIDEAKERIDTAFVNRLTAVLAYAPVGLAVDEIKALFSHLEWDFNDLNFALATRMLGDLVSLDLNGHYRVRNRRIEALLQERIPPMRLRDMAEFMLTQDRLRPYSIAPAIIDGDGEFIYSVIKRAGVSSIADHIRYLVERGQAEKAVDIIVYLADKADMRHVATVPRLCDYSIDFHRIQKDHPVCYFLNLLAKKSGEKLGILGRSVEDGAPVLKTAGEKLLFEYAMQAEIMFAQEMIEEQPEMALHAINTLYFHIYKIEGYYDYQTMNRLAFVTLQCLRHIGSKDLYDQHIGDADFIACFNYRTEYEKRVLRTEVLYEYCLCRAMAGRTDGDYAVLCVERDRLAAAFSPDGLDEPLTDEDYLYFADITGDHRRFHTACRVAYPQSVALLRHEASDFTRDIYETADEEAARFFARDAVAKADALRQFKTSKTHDSAYMEAIAAYLPLVAFGDAEHALVQQYFITMRYTCDFERRQKAWEQQRRAQIAQGDAVTRMQTRVLDRIRYGVCLRTYATLSAVGATMKRAGEQDLLRAQLPKVERDEPLCAVIRDLVQARDIDDNPAAIGEVFARYAALRPDYLGIDSQAVAYLDGVFAAMGHEQ